VIIAFAVLNCRTRCEINGYKPAGCYYKKRKYASHFHYPLCKLDIPIAKKHFFGVEILGYD
jgi:hypothetical protein